VSDHQQYQDQLNDWTAFVQSVRDQLSVCSVNSDDVRAVEIQLEYLQVGLTHVYHSTLRGEP